MKEHLRLKYHQKCCEHGVSYAIVGHSEPRKYFSESDEQINKEQFLLNLWYCNGCVGETLEQRGEASRLLQDRLNRV